MKSILATIAMVALSSSAFAGGSIDLKGGYKSQTLGVSKTTSAGIGAEFGRLGFSGKVSDSVSTKVQLDLLALIAVTAPVKYAELTHKWSDAFSLTLGKLSDAGTGGYEAARSTADQEFTSVAFHRAYALGVNADYKFSEAAAFKLNFMNTAEAAAGSSNSATGFGIAYNGSYGAIGVKANYHAVPTVVGIEYKNTTYTGVGMQYTAGALKASLDYLMNAIPVSASLTGNVSSIVGMVDYDMGNWVPNLKLESTSVTDIAGTSLTNTATSTLSSATYGTLAAGKTGTRTQMSIGTEYKVNPADPFRYQISYSTNTTNLGTSVDESTIFAGFRVAADFAK